MANKSGYQNVWPERDFEPAGGHLGIYSLNLIVSVVSGKFDDSRSVRNHRT